MGILQTAKLQTGPGLYYINVTLMANWPKIDQFLHIYCHYHDDILHITIDTQSINSNSHLKQLPLVFSLLTTDRINFRTKRYRKCLLVPVYVPFCCHSIVIYAFFTFSVSGVDAILHTKRYRKCRKPEPVGIFYTIWYLNLFDRQ